MLSSLTATLDKERVTLRGREYLVKGSKSCGLQALAEVIASRLAKELLYGTVDYELIPSTEVPTVSAGGFNCLCISSIYEKPMYQLGDYLEHMYPEIWALRTNNAIFNYLRKHNVINTQQLVDIYYFDYIIGNRDRHWNNISLCEDGYNLSPVYDYGESLLCWDSACLMDMEDYSFGLKPTHEKSVQYLRHKGITPNFKTQISNIWKWFEENNQDLKPLIPLNKYCAICEYTCTRYIKIKHTTQHLQPRLKDAVSQLNDFLK